MAFQISVVDPVYGAAVTFAQIDDVNLPSLNSGGGVINVGKYVSAATAAAGNRPVVTEAVVLTNDQAAALRAQGLPLLYALLATLPEFQGATQVDDARRT